MVRILSLKVNGMTFVMSMMMRMEMKYRVQAASGNPA